MSGNEPVAPRSMLLPPAGRRQRNHALGFLAGMGAYALVSWLKTGGATRLATWMIVTIAAAWWYSRNGGAWFDGRKGITRSALQGTGLVLAGFILVVVAGLLVPNPTAHSGSLLPSLSVSQILYLLIVIPALEEILFRGLLFEVYAHRSVLYAAVVTAGVDSIAHGIGHHDAAFALAALPGALVLGVLRGFTNGISVPISVHILVDMLAT